MSYIGNSPGNASQRVVTQKVATAGQTRFASDSGYATGYVDVIVNGSDLVAGVDFNETGDGINIDLVEACAADDNVKIVAYIPRGLSDGYTKPEANALLALKADLVAGKIPSSQLPAYVDDVLEYANLAAFPATGSTGIIYVAQDTNNCYRWSGSAYIVLTDLSSYYTKTQSDARYPQKDSGTGALTIPSGTTAQRPAGGAGKIRHNSSTGLLEFWDSVNNTWIGVGEFIAQGGTIVESGGYRYHTFISSGTFSVIQGTKPIEYLMVAGGGGAGSARGDNWGAGGGGGAGGMVAGSVTVQQGGYPIVIGGGGAGAPRNSTGNEGTSGYNSTFNGVTAVAGGKGGSAIFNGWDGGSGGGNGYYQGGTPGQGTTGQGNAGGIASGSPAAQGGGGGGGKSQTGFNATNSPRAGGNGGAGSNSYSAWATATSTGANGYFAGGGGGGVYTGDSGGSGTAGLGGSGGGGNAGASGTNTTANNGANGTPNTGGGGGGGSGFSDINQTGAGGNGGSGIVIIRYPI